MAMLLRAVVALSLLSVVVSVATITLWAGSRTIGLPVGPQVGEPEPVGHADLVATGLPWTAALYVGARARGKTIPTPSASSPGPGCE
jgi:hypothetical protein